MRSMTGFGAGEATLGEGRLRVELRAVNHKHLDLRVRLPKEIADHAVLAEQLARARLGRGRVDVAVTVSGAVGGGTSLDRAKARRAMEDFAALARELGHSGPVPLSLLATVPELYVADAPPAVESVREALTDAITAAVADLDRMREAEGAHLAADLAQRLDAVRVQVVALAAEADPMDARHRERVRARLALILDGAAGVDPARLEHEVVLAVERASVHEETTRLGSHVAQVAALLTDAGEVGRRLDFLLQEMLREANTLCAKAPEAGVTYAAVALKAELERMREQAQNVE